MGISSRHYFPSGRGISPPVFAGGFFRVCFVWEGTGFDETGLFIDMLNPDSVQLLIDEVYAPHYERYKGTCFAGFFSDEPRFGNGIPIKTSTICPGTAGMSGILGLSYPWKDSLIKELAERAEGFERGHLAALWNDTGRFTAAVRAAYMDCITRAYAENFSGALSAWCHARGLSYASHIIEDMGAHAHTFCSAGHYFRSQYGADYAGVDVVLHQIKPFCGEEKHIAPIADGYADPLFFDNTLAKLASSCSHIDKSKRGALCEIFGAYGLGGRLGGDAVARKSYACAGDQFVYSACVFIRFSQRRLPALFLCRGRKPRLSCL